MALAIDRAAKSTALWGCQWPLYQRLSDWNCEGADFGPNIGGDYTGGIHQIRIPQWQLGRPELRAVLAHELAHAETWLTGGSEANNGHSADFMRALLRAGWRAEAHRVALTVAGAQYALRQAEASLQGELDPERPPNRNDPPATYVPPVVMTQVCHNEQIAVYRQIMPGRYHLGFVIRRVCQWVPVQ